MRRNRPGHHEIDGPGRMRTVVRQPHQVGVQGTTHKVLRLAQVTPSAAPATGTTAGVCKTAVATPVCVGLCPPQTSLHSCRRVRGRHRRSLNGFAQNGALRAFCAAHEIPSAARATAQGDKGWLRS